MANEIYVLVVVDVEGALASGNLGSNVYLVDTNKYFGSSGEGQEELVTNCTDGQIIIWSVSPINPGDDAEITGFTGQAIDQKICIPQQSTLVTGETVWSARIESQGTTAKYQYSCTLSFDGNAMTFDPFLNVTA
ncbi:alpha-pore-forming tripartite toxin MakABE regulator [Pseudomonas huaxiensis]|uniref:alpha-pore-forming tripartite toxin MakABE regulator n=1 Tax=Pseudomonas huaxiensis TaxID=2213017 RepID=UPI000DA6C3B3|nr:hypothetical protein [Pseudomonas huaxiensis]